MRHGIAGNKLGRNNGLRRATVRDIAKATLVHQRVCTTIAKAKEARKLVEKLITMGKKGTLAHRRRAFAILCDHGLVQNLFMKTSPRFKIRAGGYTRIIPLVNRRGDNAALAYLELTEKEEIIISKPKSAATAKPKIADQPSHEHKREHKETEPEKVQAPEPRQAQPKSFTEHPPKDDKSGKSKAPRKITGGFKNLFRKKPSD